MARTSVCFGFFFAAFFLPAMNTWCVEAADPAMFELERLRKKAAEQQEWKSQGNVSTQDVAGSYTYFPLDRNAFTLNPGGTGKLHGGVRQKMGGGGAGTGTWTIAWRFDERSQILVIQSDQVNRQYKAIRKDGTVWMIEGREFWRQGVYHNGALGSPLDKAQRAR